MTRRRAGFTLMELLVTLSLLGVVSTIGVTAFFRVADYWTAAVRTQRLETQASAALDTIREDLDRMLSPRTGAGAFSSVCQTARHSFGAAEATANDDRITFPIVQQNAATGGFERTLVTYEIDRHAALPRLIRRVRGTDADAQAGPSVVIAEGVFSMSVMCGDPPDMTCGWDAPEPPKRVAVSLGMADPADPGAGLSRAATFELHVK
jgi:prepilin-type N-terminal cleavage/methylation domain-containing protein